MASKYTAPPASEPRILMERERRWDLKRRIDKLVSRGHGYRARKIMNLSARHYHNYIGQSCDESIPSAKRPFDICIKCERYSWDTWHEKYRSVRSLKYQPELLARESTDGNLINNSCPTLRTGMEGISRAKRTVLRLPSS